MRPSSLTPKQARTFGRILKILAVPFSVFLSTLSILWMQQFVPAFSGPAWSAFSYSGEVVAISLLGVCLPLLLSTLFVALGLAMSAGGRVVRAFRSPFYWLAILPVALVSAVAFSLSSELYGGLTLMRSWSLGAVFAGASLGVAYAWTRGKRLGLVSGLMEGYVMGTLSMFLSDVVRTLTGMVRVPGGAAVWGGGGLLDFVFWFGIYVALAEVLASVFLKVAGHVLISTAEGDRSRGREGMTTPVTKYLILYTKPAFDYDEHIAILKQARLHPSSILPAHPRLLGGSTFPFCGLDVVDPSGVFLGQNLQTGNAILYDVFEKENHNLSVMGMSGFGKSTFIKSYLARMLNRDKDTMAYLFDRVTKPEYSVSPDGKYETSFAGLTGCEVHRFSSGSGAGLDPFAIFPTKRIAANFLASVAKVESDQDLLADLYIVSEGASNVGELIELASGDLKKRLLANLPPYRFLFEGSMEIYPRMVFVLYDLPPGELRDAAAFLALSAIWRKIQDTDTIPVARRKAIVIDEGWSLVEINPRTGRPYFPLAVEYVPEIARQPLALGADSHTAVAPTCSPTVKMKGLSSKRLVAFGVGLLNLPFRTRLLNLPFRTSPDTTSTQRASETRLGDGAQ